jgi:hypothetical protein
MLLDVAYGSPERRPILQLCLPQWAVLDSGVTTIPPYPAYPISAARLQSGEVVAHVSKKPWIDDESWAEAVQVASALLAPSDWSPF